MSGTAGSGSKIPVGPQPVGEPYSQGFDHMVCSVHCQLIVVILFLPLKFRASASLESLTEIYED